MSSHEELVSIWLMTSGVLLWSLGGYKNKSYRRIILPIIVMGLLYWYGVALWRSVVCSGLLSGCAYLGYGTNTPWVIPAKVEGKLRSSKVLTAIAYNFPALILGLTWWFLLQPLIFLAVFWLSNNKETAKDAEWKVCEGIVGLIMIITIISALQRQW